MAATGFTPISNYYSATTTNVPTAGNLVAGELALNTADGKLFYKDSGGVVQTLATKSATSGVFTSVTDSGLTSGRVTYASTSGLLADSANMTFDGTTLSTTAATVYSAGASTVLTVGGNAASTVPEIRFKMNSATRYNFQLGIGVQANDAFSITPSTAIGGTTFTTPTLTATYDGNLLVGTVGTVASGGFRVVRDYDAANCANIDIGHITGSASGNRYATFAYAGSNIGSITQAGTTGVLYNVTSDYRLKSDVTPIQNALSTVEALNPVNFTWPDGRKDDGFLAHEIQAVIPNCVTGEKDAVNEDDTPKYQQMDNSGVIPFLVKAIQEQQALITTLQTQVTALQAKVGA